LSAGILGQPTNVLGVLGPMTSPALIRQEEAIQEELFGAN